MKNEIRSAALALFAGPLLFAQTITVTPSSPYVELGKTIQFTANVGVKWSAGGVVGGSATVGTITSGGLYTAPANQPAQNPVLITATSLSNSSSKGSTYVNIL